MEIMVRFKQMTHILKTLLASNSLVKFQSDRIKIHKNNQILLCYFSSFINRDIIGQKWFLAVRYA